MEDNHDKPEEQPSEDSQFTAVEQPELREISPEKLNKILEEHGKWLDSDRKEGKRANLQGARLWKANLRGANLTGAGLWGANLQGATLWGTSLQEAILREADLRGAILRKANLQGATLWRANLWFADLRGAILEYADLEKASGLTIEQLSRVKTLYRAKLDPALMEQTRKDYPHGFVEKPEDW